MATGTPAYNPPVSTAGITIDTTAITGGADTEILYNEDGKVSSHSSFKYDRASAFNRGVTLALTSNGENLYLAVGNEGLANAEFRLSGNGDLMYRMLRTFAQGYAMGMDASVSGRPLVFCGNDGAGTAPALGTTNIAQMWMTGGTEFLMGFGWPHIVVSNADRTLTALECSVEVTAMNAARAVTLPLIADLPFSKAIWVRKGVDASGSQTLTITPAVGNTVQAPYGSLTVDKSAVLLFGDKNGTEWKAVSQVP